MKAPLLTLIVAVVAVGAILGAVVLIPVLGDTSSNGGNPNARAIWGSGFNGCCFDDGIRNPSITTPPVVPNGTSVLYLVGSVSVTSWTRFNGTGNATGECNNVTGPAGACDVYIAIWTSDAWNSYASGGPLQPFWCYTGNGSACANVSEASFTTPSLSALEGQSWEIVIWNIQMYGLIGSLSFTLYGSSDS